MKQWIVLVADYFVTNVGVRSTRRYRIEIFEVHPLLRKRKRRKASSRKYIIVLSRLIVKGGNSAMGSNYAAYGVFGLAYVVFRLLGVNI